MLGELTGRILRRWSQDWREVFASALGAGLAWLLAQRFLGDAQPVFAAVSAIVCLSPRLPSHLKQTYGLLLGVGTGIVIGELSLALPGDMLLRLNSGFLCGNAHRQRLWPGRRRSHSGRRIGGSGRGVRPGHDGFRADGRCGDRSGGRPPVSQILPAPEESQSAKAD